MDNIRLMVSAKHSLGCICMDNQNEDYKKILEMIDQYINKYCDHHYIFDVIDIDVEYTKTICYCEHCFKMKE